MLKSISHQIVSAWSVPGMSFQVSASEKVKEPDAGYREPLVPEASVQAEMASGQRLLEEYAVGDALGEGAFGVVYACTHRKTAAEVAVKMVDKVETPTEVIRREAELMKGLQHHNIVRFHAVFFERCFVCIVMDKYSGGDLVDGMQDHLKERGKINCRNIVHISFQMAAAIQYLHSKNIVHRDIKGDNFLIDRLDITDTQCKIALSDFGTAVVLKRGERLSKEVGTRIFWSPEIFDKQYGLKVDIWALGIIMYGLLDGRFPFKDENDIKTKGPKYPRRLDPVCEDFIKTMLQKEEKERASADELMVHSWLSSDNSGGMSVKSSEGDASTKNQEDLSFQAEETHRGVALRRRELMERLNNEHTKGPTTVSFTHSVTLNEFSVPDRRTPGAHIRYEWWEQSKAESRSLFNAYGVERTLAEVSKSLDRSPEIVGKMLEDHNIDTAKFGVGEAETLEKFAAEIQNGSARLMLDATAHRKLVRVVDIVLLRLYSSGKKGSLLIETGEQYPDGRRRNAYRVVGTKRKAHENSQETAIRILKDVLGMEKCAVQFYSDEKEVYEEEMDSPSFPGVRTVYRKEIMPCYVKETNEEILKSIGLPASSSWSCEDGKNNTKFFDWMSESEAIKNKVKLRAEGSEEVSGLVMPPVGLNEQDLLQYLKHYEVDVSGFGQGQAKTLKEFSRELMCGESSLSLDENGQVIRIVDQIVLKVVSPSNRVLVQVAHVQPDGQLHLLNRFPAAKGRPDESQFVTARRILRKQIRIDEDQVRLDPKKARIFEESRKSASVPGMMTVYRKRIIEATVM